MKKVELEPSVFAVLVFSLLDALVYALRSMPSRQERINTFNSCNGGSTLRTILAAVNLSVKFNYEESGSVDIFTFVFTSTKETAVVIDELSAMMPAADMLHVDDVEYTTPTYSTIANLTQHIENTDT